MAKRYFVILRDYARKPSTCRIGRNRYLVSSNEPTEIPAYDVENAKRARDMYVLLESDENGVINFEKKIQENGQPAAVIPQEGEATERVKEMVQKLKAEGRLPEPKVKKKMGRPKKETSDDELDSVVGDLT